MSNPQIYVACLAAYNNGRLHGEWIDAYQSVDAIREEIQEMLNASPIPDAEEYAIHDYNDMPDLGEWPDLERVVKAAELVEQYSVEAVEAYVSHKGEFADLDEFEGNYIGEWDSDILFAVDYLSERVNMDDWPELAKLYFDWENYAYSILINEVFEDKHHYFYR